MKIATYNINSIKARCGNLCQWLCKENPDIVFLQEIKCETENFIYFECESLGYHVAVLGQKGYNGVAILSKFDFTISAQNLPNFQEDISARYIEILVQHPKIPFYVASIYAPNGCAPSIDAEQIKFTGKLTWFDKFYLHASELLQSGHPIIFAGDFNVMMNAIDVFDEERFVGSPLYRTEVKNKLKALSFLGFHDAFRLLHPDAEGYTFWDYSANSFVTNSGLRIDYIFVTAFFAERLTDCFVDKSLRTMNKPSDHTALMANFEF